MLELVDSVAIKAVNKTMNLGLKEVAASLILKQTAWSRKRWTMKSTR